VSGVKEIKRKIGSVQSTQKITSAMEMVAASKMRKARTLMENARPYAEKMRNVIRHVVEGELEYVHPFMVERKASRVGYIIISSDRGLCGGLNVNLFRLLSKEMQQWDEKQVHVNYCTVGKKAEQFFSKLPGNLIASTTELGQAPTLGELIGLVRVITGAYLSEELDKVYLAYNGFVNTMTQTPHVEQLLPIVPSEKPFNKPGWDYLYEPNAPYLLDLLLTRYVESLVYQGVVENIACEQAARMVSMKNSTDNAGEIIDSLLLRYNKARQASITQELSEIVAGAAAV